VYVDFAHRRKAVRQSFANLYNAAQLYFRNAVLDPSIAMKIDLYIQSQESPK